METILSVKNLDKTMGKRKIIDNVSFDTYSGEVFGFLGPNGAGKTTTIKMLLGMLSRDNGTAEICGLNIDKHFEKAMSYVGGIVENPENYSYLTGLQNLRLYKRMRDGVTEERISEVVNFVKLENRINDKVKKYSLGMRQRLGVAQAILHKPKLLVLDEPTNGLDPEGIRDLRDIFKKLAHEDGCSVLVSSHMLSEMELMCDRVGIIANGKMIGVKSVEELKNIGGEKTYKFTVSDVAKAIEIAAEMNAEVKASDATTLDVAVPDDEFVGAFTGKIISAGITLTGAMAQEKSLEDIFLEITGRGGQIA